MYNSYYVSGINNLYEFDCARTPDGCTVLMAGIQITDVPSIRWEDGDTVEWRYTCNLGRDVGDQYYD